MHSRLLAAIGIALGASTSPLTVSGALAAEIKACPSREKSEQILQSKGDLMPEGCRVVTVTRVDSPAGPICLMDFGQDGQGIVGAIREATTTTQWWTPCGNLRIP